MVFIRFTQEYPIAWVPHEVIGRFRYYGEPARQDDVQARWALGGQDWRPNTSVGKRVKCRMKCFYETRSHGPQDQDFDVISIWRLYLPGVEPGISRWVVGITTVTPWMLSSSLIITGVQKFAIAGKTVESQSRGGHMSWPMPCEVRRNHGRSSTSIDQSCTHGSTVSNITCSEQAIFVLLLEAWTPPGGWSLVYYREPIAEPLLW